MKRILLLVAGVLMLVLGAVGVILPLLPTTPFVIVAAVCFSASSPRMYEFLLRSKFFGPYVDNYRNKTGVPRRIKIRSIVILWCFLALSAVLSGKWWVALLLAAIGTGVTLHILSLRTKDEG